MYPRTRGGLFLLAMLATLFITPPLLWVIDGRLFVTVIAVMIGVLPLANLGAAIWYASMWWSQRHQPGTALLGVSAIFAAVAAIGLGLALEAAYRRVVDLPPVERSSFLVGWGYVLNGIAPFTTAAWLLVRRSEQKGDDE